MNKRLIFIFLIYFFVLRPSPTRVLGDIVASSLFDFLSVLLVLMVIVTIVKDKDKFNIKYDYTFLLYILLFLWSTVSLVISTLVFNNLVNLTDLFALTKYLYFFLVLVVGYNISRYVEINVFLKHVFIATIISVTVSILQFYNPLNINNLISYIYTDEKLRDITTGNARVFGTLYNANWFGVYLSFIVPIAMSSILIPQSKKKVLKVLPIITVIMASIGILLSGSRTAIIVSIIGLLFTFIFSFINKPNYKVVILPVTLILLIGFLFNNIDLNVKRFDELTSLMKSESTIGNVQSASGRVVRMEEGMAMFYDNPILGVGLSSTTELNAHNSYVTLLYRHGLIGLFIVLLFYIIYYFSFFNNFKKGRNIEHKYYSIGLTGGITAFLIATLLGEYMNSIQLYSIVLLNIGISYGYYNKRIVRDKLSKNESAYENVLRKRI